MTMNFFYNSLKKYYLITSGGWIYTKLRKNTIIQDYSQGGLKMIKYKVFTLALKSILA